MELQKTFRDAENVLGQVVFNIGGNKYRLIAAVIYRAGTVQIEDVLTHAEYDKGRWKK